jgi:hypothetical protein
MYIYISSSSSNPKMLQLRRKVALSLASEAQWPQLALVLQKSGAEAFRQRRMGIGWESSPKGAEVSGISEWIKWIIIIYPDIV